MIMFHMNSTDTYYIQPILTREPQDCNRAAMIPIQRKEARVCTSAMIAEQNITEISEIAQNAAG